MWREWIDRIAKRIYVEKCTGCHSVDRRRMRWIDIVKDCLKKRGLGIRQARIIVHDRNVWRVCEGECLINNRIVYYIIDLLISSI